jgi:hypothetical protein
MALGPVKRYLIGHTIGSDWEIVIYVGDTGYAHHVGTTEAQVLIDVLRNEAPIWYDPDTGHLRTAYETPGEGEIVHQA